MLKLRRIIARLGAAVKFLDKHYRGDSPSVSRVISHGRNRYNEKFSESASAPDGFSALGSAVPIKTVNDMPGPGGLCALPYIGSKFMFHPFTKFIPEKSNLMFEELHRKYGPIVKYRIGRKWSVLLFDPDLIAEAMLCEGKYPVRPSLPLSDVYSARTGQKRSMSQLQGEEWMGIRKPVQEFLLQPSNVVQYLPALEEVANEMRLTISQQRQLDLSVPLSEIMLRYAIESSAVYCINTRLGFQQSTTEVQSDVSQHVNSGPEVTQHGHDHSQSPSTPFRQLTNEERSQLMGTIKVYMESVGAGLYTFPLYKFFRTRLYKDFQLASDYLSTVVQTRLSVIATQLTEKGQGSCQQFPDRPNLLQSLIKDGRLDMPTCTSLLTGFMFTASDNISNSLVVLLWHLAKNRPKQTILRKEINRLVPSKMTVPQDVLSHIPYLKACLKESHRMTFPTPIGSIRILQECITLGGYHIPTGTPVHFGHNVLGHSDKYFENPQKYEPERWLKQTETDINVRRQRSIITLPFGVGPRNCVGRRLAELQMYLAVIKILQNYEISLGDPDEELDVVYKITARPSKQLDIRFHTL